MWLSPTFPDYIPDVHHIDTYSGCWGGGMIHYEDPKQLFLIQDWWRKCKHWSRKKKGKQALFILESMSFVLYLAEPALILPGDKALRVMVYAEEFWLHGASERCFYEFALYLCTCGHTSVCLLIAFYSAAGRIKKKKKEKNQVHLSIKNL